MTSPSPIFFEKYFQNSLKSGDAGQGALEVLMLHHFVGLFFGDVERQFSFQGIALHMAEGYVNRVYCGAVGLSTAEAPQRVALFQICRREGSFSTTRTTAKPLGERPQGRSGQNHGLP